MYPSLHSFTQIPSSFKKYPSEQSIQLLVVLHISQPVMQSTHVEFKAN